MSYHGKWLGPKDFTPRLRGGEKRKRDDFYGRGGFSSGFGGDGFGGGGGFGRERGFGGGFSGRGGYDNYNMPRNESASKRFHRMEMMQQIAALEEEEEDYILRERLEELNFQRQMRQMGGPEDYYGGYGGYGDGMRGRGFGGRGFGGRGFGGRGGGFGARGRGLGQRDQGWGNKDQGRGNRGGRFGKNDKDLKKGKDSKGKPPGPRPPIDYEGRDARLQKLITKMKTFEDKRDESSTLFLCIRTFNLNIDIYYYQKYSTIFLDGLYFGRGVEKPYKQAAFGEAIHKLRTKTLDEIKAEAEAAGKYAVLPAARDEVMLYKTDMNKVFCELKYVDMSFEERLKLLINELKTNKEMVFLLKVFCIKFVLNLQCIYHYHEDEPLDKHEYRVYINELFLASSKKQLRKIAEYEVIKEVFRILRKDSFEEIMKNDGRFSTDYPEPPLYVTYRGVGEQVETNAINLRFYHGIEDLDSIKQNKVQDIILLKRNMYLQSWFTLLEESASYAELLLKWVWSSERPPTTGNNALKKKNEGAAFDIKEKYNEIGQIARQNKCLIISCHVYLQDEEIGVGYGITRNSATRMAGISGYKKLLATQTSLHHTNDHESCKRKEIKLEELTQKAATLKGKKRKIPVFDNITQAEVFVDDYIIDRKEDDIEKDVETEAVENIAEIAKESEKNDKMAPWIKEAVREDLEALSKVDCLIESGLLYSDVPMYLYQFTSYYCYKYNLQMRTRIEGDKLIELAVTKLASDLNEVVNKLKDIEGHSAHGFTLEQLRKEDGTLEVFTPVGKKDNKLRKA